MNFLSKLFRKKNKKIAFLDGDQALGGVLNAYNKYLIGTETHLIRLLSLDAKPPKRLNDTNGINKIYLRGYSTGKEVSDKFIGAFIQKSIHDGYTDITVGSSDYDFIDIFKMAIILNPNVPKLNFRIIVPHAQGRLKDMPNGEAGIGIVRD